MASGRSAAAGILLGTRDGATFEAVASHRVSGTAWFVTWRTHCIDCGVELMAERAWREWRALRAERCQSCVTDAIAFGQKKFDIPEAQTENMLEPDRVAD
ncbi:MAG TPA: hypothetical protein VKI44_05765 [Acetobacteraceae bacterium]|nr:hypothetical protein [Acetobacteraceae bacterium]